MGSIENISELCRLCLISDQVNVPIFDENPTKEQTFVKINSCLPVKVSRDDSLPKKICDGCSYKLDMCYTFRNASVEAEKQLLELLNQAGLSACTDLMSNDPLASTKAEIMVKQETFEPIDARGDGDTSDMGLDSHNYIMQQQKLAYPQDFDYAEASGSATDVMTDEPAPKRAKRAAALNKAPVETDDDDLDAVMDISKVTKAEDEDSEDVDQPEYAEVPSTSADEQPGPSGVGKAAAEAPWTTTEENFYECPTCFKILSTRRQLSRHKTTHREVKKHTCSVCGQMFSYISQLKQHVLYQHDKRPQVFCNLCDFGTLNNYRLRKHMINQHTRDFPFKCGICGKGYVTKSLLAKHEEVQHEGIRFSCEFCSKTFKDQTLFRQHVAGHNPDYVKKTYPCQVCFKVLKCEATFKRHVKRHQGELESFVCDFCGKVVRSANSLKNHRKIHTGEKQHVCDFCGKAFTLAMHLKIHRRVHTKERPFKCKFCERAFSQKNTLNIHVRCRHTGEKPYKCDFCSRQFPSRTALNAHKCKVLLE